MDLSAALSRLGAPDYLDGLESWPIEQVRDRRAECQAVEDGVSYLRRLVQGHLDLVAAELRRRADGAPPAELSDLVASLPSTLAEGRATGGLRRPMRDVDPGAIEGLTAELDELLGENPIGTLPERSDDDLRALEDALGRLERRVSDDRKLVFGRLDALSGELTRRYRSGEASVDAVLREKSS